MSARGKRFSKTIAAAASIAFLRVNGLLPLSASRAIGRGIGWLAYHLIPRVSKVALANLDLAYGDSLTQDEKRRIAKSAATNMGIVAAEFAHSPKVYSGAIPIRIEGSEHIDESRGCVFVGAHLGNWEWAPPSVVSLGRKAGGIVRPLDHPWLNRAVDQVRRDAGVITIEKDSASTSVRRLLREGVLIGILIDQNPRENAVPVTFFGQRTWATTGPALIALRARCPVHAVSVARGVNGDYSVQVSPPIQVESTGDLRQDVQRITQECQDMIEGMIREHPGQWLWMHRRFKARPRLEAEWAEREVTSTSKLAK